MGDPCAADDNLVHAPDDTPAHARLVAAHPPVATPPAKGESAVQREARRGLSWFAIGFSVTLGGFLAYTLAGEILRISELMILLMLAFFVAVSLDPFVRWLVRRGLKRGLAVGIVLAAFTGVIAGFMALVIPLVTNEVTAFSHAVPGWLEELRDHHSTLGRMEDHYHLIEKAKQQFGSGGGSSLFSGLLGAGQVLLTTVTDTVIVIVVALYFMAGLPQIKEFAYRFVPASGRERARALTDQVFVSTGRYMLGNLATSLIAGVSTFVWCSATSVPYAAALGVLVALLDLVPMVGSTVGGVVVSLVALAVSVPIAIATAVFYIAFRVAEDYLIVPRVMRHAVDVHPIVTVVAVLLGGALLGIIGALVAIPAAMTLGLLLDEFVFPRTDTA
ncbi:AI-2E family transporter [Streptomyces sp. SL54]|uniref:AI-2E family transporter n=1 Tax=Streptantibioticus silvisoli TaxID=2705255 RepID=A0ABT6VS00_9ACTN|nr:AI-2E family transporter [Streptantibioticus silvisoli]